MSETQKQVDAVEPIQRADGKFTESTWSSQEGKAIEPLPADHRRTLEADIAKFLAEFDGGES